MEACSDTRFVYLDGSTFKDGLSVFTGCGYTVSIDHKWARDVHLPLAKFGSPHVGELYAILTFLLSFDSPDRTPYILFVDSLELVKSIGNPLHRDPIIRWIIDLISQYLPFVRLIWIPSHCGVPGNDRAHSLARLGAIDAYNSSLTPLTPPHLSIKCWRTICFEHITRYSHQHLLNILRNCDHRCLTWNPQLRSFPYNSPDIPPTNSLYLFKAFIGSTCNEFRYSRQVATSPTCPYCPTSLHSIHHVLTECPASRPMSTSRLQRPFKLKFAASPSTIFFPLLHLTHSLTPLDYWSRLHDILRVWESPLPNASASSSPSTPSNCPSSSSSNYTSPCLLPPSISPLDFPSSDEVYSSSPISSDYSHKNFPPQCVIPSPISLSSSYSFSSPSPSL